MRIRGREATDAELLAAFDAVEDARVATPGDGGAPTPLTYFEFGTLAALWLFARAGLDALVLEVGLGGRLDAVNVVDATVAVLTSVAIDHTDYLGPTREDIGREKAGIFRAGRAAVCADPHPPASVVARAEEIGGQAAADRPRLRFRQRRHAVEVLGTGRRALRPAVPRAARRLPARTMPRRCSP